MEGLLRSPLGKTVFQAAPLPQPQSGPLGHLPRKMHNPLERKEPEDPQGGDVHVAWAFCNRSAEGGDLPMDLKNSTRRNVPPTGHVGGHLGDATPVHHSSPPVQDHANERFLSERPWAPLYTHTLHPEAQQRRSTVHAVPS